MNMRLSKTVEQACCILSILAEHHGQPVTNVELNERMNVSQSYLTKITRKLVIAGIIRSAQGVKGGFVLAQPMDFMSAEQKWFDELNLITMEQLISKAKTTR